jgi:general secretion pathway protein D
MRARAVVLFVAFLVMFAGCATKKEFTEGKRLIAEGKLDMGLASLEEAARKEPDNLEIRTILARQREAVAARHLLDADNARSRGDLVAAEQGYRRALEINPHNERAQAGLTVLDMDRRHPALVKRAEELIGRKEYAAAEQELRTVLQENPQQKDARRLLQHITEIEFQAEKVGPVLKTAYKKPVTLEFRDAGLKSIFEIIARAAGINVVFDKDVRQDSKATIYVRDTNVEDVFKLLLMTNQLAHKVLNENSVLIYPNTPAKQKEYQELSVRSFFVVNTDVKQMVAMVRGLVKTKDMHVDERLNSFVMKDTPDAIRLVERLIAVNDLADPEVMLEVEVLEIRRDILRNLGFLYPDQVRVNMLNAATAAAGIPPPDFRISSAGINGGTGNLDNLTAIILNPALVINLKQTEAIINVLANPRIRVKNREKAKILIGDKVPVVTTTATANVGVASSVSYLEVGLKLDVESTITLHDEVSMKVSLEVSNIVKEVQIANGGLAYQVGTRTAATTLALKDGETQVLAGLINDDERAALVKVPGLGELPWFGKLFTNQNYTRNKTEIALLITPRVVRNISRPARIDSDLHFGTESAVGARPLTIKKSPPNSLAMASSSGQGPGMGFAAQPAVPMDEPRASRDAAPGAGGVPVLMLVGPEQVLADKEFAVSVSLGGADSLPPGELEISYDASALELLDGGEKSGSRVLKLGKGGGGAELRFKAVAQKPVTTQVSIKSLTLQGESGSLPEVPLPPALSIDIR